MSSSGVRPEEASLYFRDEFRRARAAALEDAEGYQRVLFALERFGSYVTKATTGLGKYREEICRRACVSPLADDIPRQCREHHLPFRTLYELVREARNDALHQGAFARQLTTRTVELCLVLEDALMADAASVSDFMVKTPVCAEPWHPLSFIRQIMLENSFSHLPARINGDWYWVSDFNLAVHLRCTSKKERAKRLAARLDEATRHDPNLLIVAHTVFPDEPVEEVVQQVRELPAVVVARDDPGRIVGIITAFDLL